MDVDVLARIGPALGALQSQSLESLSISLRVETALPALAEQVQDGRAQGRVTAVVLVAQLLVLVAVVLWMVLAAATDDRRPEIALARLRGRGRGGAARFLLAELLPLSLVGVALGHRGFPVGDDPGRLDRLPRAGPARVPVGFMLAALGSAVAVAAVVLVAARRAVREPVDSLLRGVRARRAVQPRASARW